MTTASWFNDNMRIRLSQIIYLAFQYSSIKIAMYSSFIAGSEIFSKLKISPLQVALIYQCAKSHWSLRFLTNQKVEKSFDIQDRHAKR